TPHVCLLRIAGAAPKLTQQGFTQIGLPTEDRLRLSKFRNGLAKARITVILEAVLQQIAGLRQCPSARGRRRAVNAREIRDVPVPAFAFGQNSKITQHLPSCCRLLRLSLLSERERLINQSGGYIVTQTKVAAAEDAPDSLFIAGLARLLKSV